MKNSPRHFINCDETFLPLDYTREQAITRQNAKNVYMQAHGTTDHITMPCAASAVGAVLPPMIIILKLSQEVSIGSMDQMTQYIQRVSQVGWTPSYFSPEGRKCSLNFVGLSVLYFFW